jgi:hypothetical protein
MSKQTLSEQLFEDFCVAHQLDWERLSPSSQKGESMPDYAIRIDETTIEVEIKEIESREGLNEDGSGSRIVGKHVRGAIDAARKQVQTSAGRGNPSLLLIYNAIDNWQLFGTEEHDFLAAMYGEITVRFALDKDSFSSAFHGKNARLMHDKNRSFSSVGHLKKIASAATEITLYENIYARIQMPFARMPACFEIKRIEIASDS